MNSKTYIFKLELEEFISLLNNGGLITKINNIFWEIEEIAKQNVNFIYMDSRCIAVFKEVFDKISINKDGDNTLYGAKIIFIRNCDGIYFSTLFLLEDFKDGKFDMLCDEEDITCDIVSKKDFFNDDIKFDKMGNVVDSKNEKYTKDLQKLVELGVVKNAKISSDFVSIDLQCSIIDEKVKDRLSGKIEIDEEGNVVDFRNKSCISKLQSIIDNGRFKDTKNIFNKTNISLDGIACRKRYIEELIDASYISFYKHDYKKNKKNKKIIKHLKDHFHSCKKDIEQIDNCVALHKFFTKIIAKI